MKKSMLLFVCFCFAVFSYAQKNEIRFTVSGEVFTPIEYDFGPNEQRFSLGMEYSRKLWKRLDIEAGLTYSKTGYYAFNLCPECFPYYETGREVNASIGLRWRIIDKKNFGIYTSAGIKKNKRILPDYYALNSELKHATTSLYQDLGMRFKINKHFSIDFELKGQYNLRDHLSIYYYKRQINLGAGIGFNYSF